MTSNSSSLFYFYIFLSTGILHYTKNPILAGISGPIISSFLLYIWNIPIGDSSAVIIGICYGTLIKEGKGHYVIFHLLCSFLRTTDDLIFFLLPLIMTRDETWLFLKKCANKIHFQS